MSPTFMNDLRQSTEVMKFLGQTDFDNKDISFTITKYEGRQLVEVAPERFRTNIVLFGQEGFTWGQGSQAINFLGIAKDAATHIVKYEKIKVISGDLNLAAGGFDGYTIFARIYHDVFVPDNKKVGIYCNLVPASANDTTLTDLHVVEATIDSSRKVTSLNYYPGDKMVLFGAVAATTAPTTVPQTPTLIKLGDTLPAATSTNNVYVYAFDATGILATQQVLAKTGA